MKYESRTACRRVRKHRLTACVKHRDDRIDGALVQLIGVNRPDFTYVGLPLIRICFAWCRDGSRDFCAAAHRQRRGFAQRLCCPYSGFVVLSQFTHVDEDWLDRLGCFRRFSGNYRQLALNQFAIHQRNRDTAAIRRDAQVTAGVGQRLKRRGLIPVAGANELDIASFAKHDDRLAIRRHTKVNDRRFVDKSGGDNRIDAGFLSRQKSPDSEAIIGAASQDKLAIAGDVDGKHFAFGLTERIETASRLDLPDLDRFVGTGTDQNFAIGRKSEIKNGTVVAREFANDFAGADVPQQNLAVVTGRGNHRLVG